MEETIKKTLKSVPYVSEDELLTAIDYIAASRPDGWHYGVPNKITWKKTEYRISRDDRPGLRDYPSACGIACDGSRIFLRLHYLLLDKMTEGICIAWSVDE